MTSNPDAWMVLILDTRTSGLKNDGGEVIEIGAVLYSIKYRCIVSEISTLLPPSRPSNTNVKVNHIPVGAAMSVSLSNAQSVCRTILSWANDAKYLIAHNAEVDRKWISSHCLLSDLARHNWLCTSYDVIWPKQQRPGMNLVHLALAHGIGVTCAHRALSECQLIASLFTSIGDTLSEILDKAARPKCKVLAKVHYLERDVAHNAGFKWEGATRVWSRWVAIEDLPSLPVKCTVVEVDTRGNDAVSWARLWQMYISHKVREDEKEDVSAFEHLGRNLWNCVKTNPALLTALRCLWAESERGGIEPLGLLETFQAMEVWYWTFKCHVAESDKKLTMQQRPFQNHPQAIYNLPDVLGSENGDARATSEEAAEAFAFSVESVIEKVAQSCLEPEDRQAVNFPHTYEFDKEGSDSSTSP
eukprot:g3683.t1